MKFVQTIEFTTSRMDEMDKLEADWRKATEGRRTVIRDMKTRDRDNPNTYMLIVEFDSYDDAMKNNEMAETQKIAEGMAQLADSPAVFRNFDVLDENS
jgi:hypothetical protein